MKNTKMTQKKKVRSFNWNWKEFFDWKNSLIVLFGILFITLHKYKLLIGGGYFVFIGVLLFIEKNKLSKASGVGAVIIGLFAIFIFLKLSIDIAILLYLLLIISMVFYSIDFFKKIKKGNLYDKIENIIKTIFFTYLSYFILIAEMPKSLKNLISAGIVNYHDYVFAIAVPILSIIIISNLIKNLRSFLKGKENIYLDLSIGTILFIFFIGYYLIKNIPKINQMNFFWGIIVVIFLIIGTISSLKSIIETN